MPKAIMYFPAGLLWGSATAAYCVEGASPASDWSEWGQQPEGVLDESKPGRACEWWAGRWREDFDRAQETHQTALRLSVEWARVQPEPDRWDEPALDRYREMLIGLNQRGISPLVCLHHNTNPLWFANEGGWENEQAPAYFAEYARRVVEALKAYCALWVTFSAPNAYALSAYQMGTFPPGRRDAAATGRSLVNLAKAHAGAYAAAHALQSNAQVGFTHLWSGAARRAEAGQNVFPLAFQTGKLEYGSLRENLPQLKESLDFLGIDYFSREPSPGAPKAERKKRRAPDAIPAKENSEGGYPESDPTGLREAIKWGGKFALPMYITANGCDDARDEYRRAYLAEHVHALWHMVNFNAPVRGYFHWSLIDHISWERGWNAKFGLWAVDPQTQLRSRRESADFYAEICRTGALSSDMVEKYSPGVFDKLFPV